MTPKEKIKTTELSYAVASEMIEYDYENNSLIWKIKRANYKKKGDVAGSFCKKTGYVKVALNNKTYLAHRLIWFLHYKNWPKNQIDHINGNRTDNKIENLREVTARQNSQNQVKHRKGKLVGANYFKSRNKWASEIVIKRKRKFLGYFSTEEDAHNAYMKEVKKLASIEQKLKDLK